MTHRVMMREDDGDDEDEAERAQETKVAKLTKENLDQRFSDANNVKQNDIETESVL